jgi:hypothetical protein
MVRLIARVAAGFALLAALGACYITGAGVIPPERAQAIPGIEGNWLPADNSSTDLLTISARPGSNDYDLTSNAQDAQNEKLTARGFQVAGNVYIVQMWNEAALDEGVVLVFVSVDGDTIGLLGVTSDAQALASQAGVVLAEDNVTLDGEPAKMLGFVDLHQTAQFTEATPMMKRAP